MEKLKWIVEQTIVQINTGMYNPLHDPLPAFPEIWNDSYDFEDWEYYQ